MFSRFPIYYTRLKQCAAPTTVIMLYINICVDIILCILYTSQLISDVYYGRFICIYYFIYFISVAYCRVWCAIRFEGHCTNCLSFILRSRKRWDPLAIIIARLRLRGGENTTVIIQCTYYAYYIINNYYYACILLLKCYLHSIILLWCFYNYFSTYAVEWEECGRSSPKMTFLAVHYIYSIYDSNKCTGYAIFLI